MTPKDPNAVVVDALSPAQAKDELKRLAKLIRHHDELYYRQDAPEISDAEYDALRLRNAAIEARFPKLVRPDSPSRRVGAAPVDGFGKVRHRVPMLSLGNAFDAEDVTRVRRAHPPLPAPRPRMRRSRSSPSRRSTGSPSRCSYANGRLVEAATRGDGAEGENVTGQRHDDRRDSRTSSRAATCPR